MINNSRGVILWRTKNALDLGHSKLVNQNTTSDISKSWIPNYVPPRIQAFRLVHESRMIRMIGLIILVAQIIILMTRMIAQICKNIWESIKNTLRGAAASRSVLAVRSLMFLYIWAIILVIRMIIWATRMISPIILNHPRVRQKPVLDAWLADLQFRFRKAARLPMQTAD